MVNWKWMHTLTHSDYRLVNISFLNKFKWAGIEMERSQGREN